MRDALARFAGGLLFAACFAAAQAAPRVDVISVNLNPLIDKAVKSPTRFAVDIPHVASPTTAGEWSTSGDLSTWTYSARIPGAVSMSFHASLAALPESAILTVTANGVRYVYTASDARTGEIWSRIGRGDSLAFELKVPAKDAARVQLDIASLQAGYRAFGVGMRNHRHYDELRTQSVGMTLELASCAENWACNTTPANQGAGEATAALVISNVSQCTGVLLNNARGDGTPYMLTARHCQNGDSDGGAPWAAGIMRVYWNAVSACGATMGTIYDIGTPSQYGAQTVVEQQDAWLVRLSAPPIVDAYYSGWDATGATIIGGFTPHHAFGSTRQFIGWHGQAFYITKPVGSFEDVHYASILWGTVNALGAGGGGASGAGLFNDVGRLVGTVVRGDETGDGAGVCPVLTPPAPSDATATTLSTAFSGIFYSTSDPVSSTGSVTLQSVLDPDHTGVQVLDGRKRAITVTLEPSNPQPVSTGNLIELQWTTTPGTQTCTASGGVSGDGWAGPLTPPKGNSKVTRFDEGDTTYTVTCTDGQGRTGTASTTLHWTLSTPGVNLYPTGVVEYGLPFEMEWNSTVAPCTASGGIAGWAGAVTPRGTRSMTPTTVGTVAFTLTCGSGTRVASSTISVTFPGPSVAITTDATTLRIDQPAYLHIVHRGGPCIKTGGASGDGWAGNLPASTPFSTDITVNESAPGTYTYTLACGSGAHIATSQATIAFTNDPPAASIQASAVTGTINTGAITISWDSNVRVCSVGFDAPQGNGFGLGAQGPPHGSIAVQAPVIGQYVYWIKCGTGANAVQASTTVNWTGTPVVTVDGLSDAIRGSPFTLGYSTNILPCTTSGGVAGDGWNGQTLTRNTYNYFSVIEQAAGQITFTITCGSGAQTGSASKTVNVVADAPRLTLISDQEVQLTGHPITLTWTSNFAPCQFFGGGSGDGWNGTVAGSTGSMTVTEAVAGSYYYRVTCGSPPVLYAMADTTVTFSDFPAPTLTANKTQSATGENVTLTWASPDGSACIAAGGEQGDGWAGNRAASGSVDVKEQTVGYMFFYITCGPSPTVRAKVQFFALPTVKLNSQYTSVPVGTSFFLSWGATNADSCTAGGGSQANGWTGNLSASSGTLEVRETTAGTYTYSVNCVGFANRTASANVSVTVTAAPPPPSGGGSTGGSSSGGGGGGGAMGPVDIGGCLAIALLAWRQRRRASLSR